MEKIHKKWQNHFMAQEKYHMTSYEYPQNEILFSLNCLKDFITEIFRPLLK